MTKFIRTDLRPTGKAMAIALPLVAIMALSVVVIGPNRSQASSSSPPDLASIAPRSLIVGAELYELGLTPEVFAAAGVSSQQVEQIIAVLSLDSGSGVDRFRSARLEAMRAESAYEERAQAVRSGKATSAEIGRGVDLRGSLDHRRGVRNGAEQRVMKLVAAALDAPQEAALETIRANTKAGVVLPYAATDLAPGDRLRLREYLAAKRESERTGRPLDPSVSGFLASLDARPEVVTAQHGLDAQVFVRSAFNAALARLDSE